MLWKNKKTLSDSAEEGTAKKSRLTFRAIAMMLVMTMLVAMLAVGLTACNSSDSNSDDDDDEKITNNNNNDDDDDDDDNDDNDDNDDDHSNVDTSDMSGEELLQFVQGEAIEDLLDAITGAYGQINAGSGNSSNSTSAEVNMTLRVGDEILDLLEDMIASEMGQEMDMSWLSEINLDMETNVTKDLLMQLDMGLGLGGTRLATISAIMDMEDMMMWFGVPELSDTFIELDMSQAGMDMSMMDGTMDQVASLMEALPDAKVVNKLLTKYIDIALENLDGVEKTTETLELDGLKQECTVLTVEIYQEDALRIAKAILEEAKDDADLKTVIEDFGDFINEINKQQADQYGYEWEEIDAYAEFSDAVESALASLEETSEDLDTETCFRIVTYVDNANNVIGHRFATPDGDEVYYMTVTEGNAFSFEANLGPAVITGSGTIKSGVTDAEYTLSVEGTDFVVLELIDMEENSGTIRLEPTAEVMEMIFDGADLPVALADLALELKYSDDGFELNILANNKLLIGLAITGSVSNSASVDIPSDTVDPMDQEALMQWLQDMDFDEIIDNLKDAGVPSELTDMVEMLAEQIASGGGFAEEDTEYPAA